MVQIFVKLAEDPKEWSIIELQGTLESNEEDLAGSHVGNLHFDDKGTPHLIVGHHVMTGKVQKLDKPFAVMKKQKSLDGEYQMDVDRNDEVDSLPKDVSYDVVAFVKKKIIFKNRPKPIIIKTQPIRT